MTAMTEAAPAAMRYLGAVEHELADLPADDRSALLEDLALHLDALGQDDDDRPLEVRLGRPAEYAAELRAAAGLPPRGATRGALPAVRRDLERLVASRPVRELRAFVPQLRPAWWVLRGYLVVLLPTLTGVDGSRDFPVPAPFGSNLLGTALVLLAVVVSVGLGRRRLPRPAAVAVFLLDVVLLVVALDVAGNASSRLRDVVYASSGPSGPGVTADQPLWSPFGPVTDVLPYAADGTQLEGVLLFDQDGRPLRVGQQQWWADGCRRALDHPRAADGVPVPFSYPQAYVLDPSGTAGPAGLGQCVVDRERPQVPLPVFPMPATDQPPAPPVS